MNILSGAISRSPDGAALSPASSSSVRTAAAPGGHFAGLDALRAIAAICVIAYHVVLLNALAVPVWSTIVVYRLGLAVPLFYVVSAFSLALGYYGRLDTIGAIARYAVRRFFRIAPLFYIMLLIWVCVMGLKFHQPPSPFAIAANLTFLFGFIPGVHESIVWAGWSVGVEMIFYAVLPLLLIAARGVRSNLLLYVGSLVAAVAFQKWIGSKTSYGYMNIITQAPHFMLGLLAFHIHRRGLLTRFGRGQGWLLLAGLAIWPLIALFRLNHQTVWGVDVEQYLIALAFPLVLLSQLGAPTKLLVNRLTIFLGRRSFSLYLLHPLVIVATMPLVQALSVAHGPKVAAVGGFVIVVLAVTAAASITYPLIEAPFMNLGRMVGDRMRRSRIAPVR